MIADRPICAVNQQTAPNPLELGMLRALATGKTPDQVFTDPQLGAVTLFRITQRGWVTATTGTVTITAEGHAILAATKATKRQLAARRARAAREQAEINGGKTPSLVKLAYRAAAQGGAHA